MLKICAIWLRENLRVVDIAAAIILEFVCAIAAIEAGRPVPVSDVVRVIGTIQGIQQLNSRQGGITYRLRLEDDRIVLVSDRRDRPRHWVGSEILVEQATYENGSISYRFVD
jgi:hypothetical protein